MAQNQAPVLNPDDYWKTRNYRISARLHLQHALFQSTIGYLVHPQITASWTSAGASQRTLRVADLGCGNGRWLLDLAKQAPPRVSLELYGFDINPVNLPTTCHLPSNVKLELCDILASELPVGLENTFDLVHIRALSSSVLSNDPSRIVHNATRLLVPGGWLQWEETTTDQLVAVPPSPDAPKSSCDTIIDILEQGAKAQDMSFEWVYEFDSFFKKRQLEDIQVVRINKRPEDLKAWTENYLLVWEDLTQILPSHEKAPDAPLTREKWFGLFLKAAEEADKGVVIHQTQVVVAIGRKSNKAILAKQHR